MFIIITCFKDCYEYIEFRCHNINKCNKTSALPILKQYYTKFSFFYIIFSNEKSLSANWIFNPNESEDEIIQIENSVWISPRLDSFRLKIWLRIIRLETELIRLNRIDFWPFFMKRDTKHFSDWFRMIPNVSETEFRFAWNSSDWIYFWNFRQDGYILK